MKTILILMSGALLVVACKKKDIDKPYIETRPYYLSAMINGKFWTNEVDPSYPEHQEIYESAQIFEAGVDEKGNDIIRLIVVGATKNQDEVFRLFIYDYKGTGTYYMIKKPVEDLPVYADYYEHGSFLDWRIQNAYRPQFYTSDTMGFITIADMDSVISGTFEMKLFNFADSSSSRNIVDGKFRRKKKVMPL